MYADGLPSGGRHAPSCIFLVCKPPAAVKELVLGWRARGHYRNFFDAFRALKIDSGLWALRDSVGESHKSFSQENILGGLGISLSKFFLKPKLQFGQVSGSNP